MKRHRDALGIQEGACNPSGITHSLLAAIREAREQNPSTDSVCRDPAVRLIIHQLGFICGLYVDMPDWDKAMAECRAAVAADDAATMQPAPNSLPSDPTLW